MTKFGFPLDDKFGLDTVCKALGIASDRVYALTIEISARGYPEVTIRRFLHGDDLEKISDMIRNDPPDNLMRLKTIHDDHA